MEEAIANWASLEFRFHLIRLTPFTTASGALMGLVPCTGIATLVQACPRDSEDPQFAIYSNGFWQRMATARR